MRPRLRLLLLSALVSALLGAGAGAGAQTPRSEFWRRSLEAAPELPPRVEALAEALAAGDAAAVAAQFGAGRLRLQLRPLAMPPTLCGHSEARVLLRDYFGASAPASGDLHVGPVSLEPGNERARVAFDQMGVPVASGLPARRRFVAVYRLEAGVWCLEALRCP